MEQKELADGRILRLFAIGQLGWAILSGIISNWLVYFYMPSETMLGRGMSVFITQGAVFLGLTVIGVITGCGRLLDGFIDPYIASRSDSLKNPLGRRIPFMRLAAVPFALMTTLVFVVPGTSNPTVNNVLLFVCLMLFYVTLSLYCTPFNALIPELGRTQELRINLSTYISVTYFLGTALAYLVTTVTSFLEPTFGLVGSFRLTVAVLSVLAAICMLVPAFGIDETRYADIIPSDTPMFQSVGKTFRNRNFLVFESSDVLYWVAITMFQTGMTYYITELMGLSDSLSFVFFAAMTVISLAFYAPVNVLAKKYGKKRLVAFGFFFFCVAFFVTSVCGQFGIPGMVWGVLVAVLAAIPMAILGILPQAVLADIAEADSVVTGENRSGMFYAARSFSMTLGQTLAMILFTSVSILGTNGLGYRLTAVIATCFCLAGGLIFTRYRERDVLKTIDGNAPREPEGKDGE
jgi:GPH family glycoside/pentoside/hexuronide:cation symporter